MSQAGLRWGALSLGLVAAAAHAERVSGHVRLETGDGKAHVRVVVAPENPRRCERAPALFRAALLRQPKVLAETDTNARGEFVLEYEPEGQPQLEIVAPGHDVFRFAAEPDVSPGQSPQRRGFGLNRAARPALLRVFASPRHPLPGARVTYSPEDSLGPVTVVAAANGSVRVGRAGCYLVEAAGYATKVVTDTRDVFLPRAPRVLVKVSNEGAPAEATLSIEDPSVAPVREEVATDGGVAVIDSFGVPFTLRARSDAGLATVQVSTQDTREVALELRPLAHLWVTTPLAAMEWLTVEVDGVSAPLRPVRDDPDAGVEFDLTEGTHLLKVTGAAHNSRVPKYDRTEWIDVRGTRTERLDLRRQVLTGQVVSAAGAPVSGATVHVDSDLKLRCGMGMGMCTPVQRFTAQAVTVDGGFSLALLEPGEYRVTAYSPELGTARAKVSVPAAAQRLVLEPGAPLSVKAGGGAVALYDPDTSPDLLGAALLLTPVVRGVARFENLRGRYRAVSADGEDLVEVGDAGVELALTRPRRRSEIAGTVVDERGRPVDLSVCAVLRSGGRCARSSDGGFSVEVEVSGAAYRIALSEDEWVASPVRAKAGDAVTLHARRWKPTQVRVTDPEGAPVPGLTASTGKVKGSRVTLRNTYPEVLSAPGFAPRVVEPESVPPTVQLERLPLTGTVRQPDGDRRPARWWRSSAKACSTTRACVGRSTSATSGRPRGRTGPAESSASPGSPRSTRRGASR